jgi:preprotein translocase subunit YajC
MNNPIAQQLVFFAGIILIFYLLVIRPNQQQKRKHEQTLLAIKKGDEVVTNGGIIGDVIHVKTVNADGTASFDDRLTIRSGEARLIVERGRVARVTPPGTQSTSAKASASSSAS